MKISYYLFYHWAGDFYFSIDWQLIFLMPFIIKDVPMSNTQISLIVAGFSLTWALGGYFGGYFADRLGKRKVFFSHFGFVFFLFVRL